jgi:copper(I)-binding protein
MKAKYLVFPAVMAACLLILSPLQAHEIRAGQLVIVHPMVDEAAENQAMAHGSMEIRNEGNSSDQLISISSEFAEQSEISGSTPVTIPAHGHAAVAVLFKKIKTKLSEDEAYAGELTLAKAGKIKIDLMVHTHKH